MPSPENNLRSGHGKGSRLVLQGMAANLLLAGVKMTAGVLGNAFALIADAVESLLDVASSLIIWGGLKFAAKPPDLDHPYGHGKAEPIASLAVAVCVIAAAGGLALECLRTLAQEPPEPPRPFTLVVLLAVVVVKLFLSGRMARAGKQMDSTALKTEAWHHWSDAVTSAAAFIGIGIALIGGPGCVAADKYAALLACAVIAGNGVRLVIPALAEIMDAAPPPELVAQVRAAAAQVPGVRAIDKCHARKMGLDYYVDIHILVSGSLSVREGHRIAHAVKDRLRGELPGVRDALVHIEPTDGEGTEAADATPS